MEKSRILIDKTALRTEEQQAVEKIKPKLRKFVIDKQVENAQKAATEQKKDADLFLSKEEVLVQAQRLAVKCFLHYKYWRENPPAVEMPWLQHGPATAALQQEMQADIAAFAKQLIIEYYKNYIPLKKAKRGYLNPMDEKNLRFFWVKFNADLMVLINADKKRRMAGNAGIVLADRLPDDLPVK